MPTGPMVRDELSTSINTIDLDRFLTALDYLLGELLQLVSVGLRTNNRHLVNPSDRPTTTKALHKYFALDSCQTGGCNSGDASAM